MKLKNVFQIIAMLLVVFMAGCKKDEDIGVRPRVTAINPINKATGTGIDSKVSATFSVAMDPSSINTSTFTLQQGTTSVSGAVAYTGTTATFTPAANLTPSTVYTATITLGAKDTNGKSLAKDYISSFTTGASATGDKTPPTVTLTDPANNATGVSLDHLVVTTFSKPMDHTTITSLTITLKQGTTPVSGTVTYTGTKATFTPSSKLEPNKLYTSTITIGAKDLAGNALASNYVNSFTTGDAPDTALPMVNSTDPLNNATGVAPNKVVALTFSEAMDPLTINATTFTLKKGATAVSGAVAYSVSTKKGTFTPSNPLDPNVTYAATITTGAKDLAGNPLAANFVWSFITTTPTTGPAVVNLGSAGNYVILAKTAISNVPTSAIVGNMGLSPAATSFITGFVLTNVPTDSPPDATAPEVVGKIFAADMAAPTGGTGFTLDIAIGDMMTAYTDAAGRPTPDFLELGIPGTPGNIGGLTLAPGLYKWAGTVSMPIDVTISGGANDVWIFQIGGDLTMDLNVKITLTGGAQPKNIFWQVAGQSTLAPGSHFEGNILSQTAITFQTGASMNGRALAQTLVALDGNAITKP